MKLFMEPPEKKGSYITIGNFDGIHIGHKEVIRAAKARSIALRHPLVAVTFWPHPSEFFGKRVKLIQTLEQRLLSLREMVDETLVLPFGKVLSGMNPLEFVKYLRDRMNFKEIFVGKGFRFGKGRVGDAFLLENFGREIGFRVWALEKVYCGGEKVSSTRIRKLLQEGKVKEASPLLGKPYSIEGFKVSGEGLGKKLGFPTVNIIPLNEILPKGIYKGYVKIRKKFLRSAIYIGNRPTFGGKEVILEAYSIDSEVEVEEGEKVEAFLLKRIRDERKFSGAEELRKYVQRDVKKIIDSEDII